MLIDSHIHLDAAEFAPDRAVVIEAARAAGSLDRADERLLATLPPKQA